MYYLRARYYQPDIGRFISEDTHWNLDNMIYGDEPGNPDDVESFKIKTPDYTAIVQSLNKYAYCAGNPVSFADTDGESLIAAIILAGVAAAGALVLSGCNNNDNLRNSLKDNYYSYDDIYASTSKLQHEYSRHAADYGVFGNWNTENGELFRNAIIVQMNKVSNPILGTYRGTISVYHFYDPETGIDTMVDLEGNFIAGWKLSQEQKENLERNGNVQ